MQLDQNISRIVRFLTNLLKTNWLIVTLVVVCMVGCDKPKTRSTEESEIRIGEFASLTGGTADFGISTHNGATLAVEEANINGGLLGKKIVLITEDNRSMAGESSTV